MKVCLLIRSALKETCSGVDRYAWELISNLYDLGVNPIVITQGKLDTAFPIKKIPSTIKTFLMKADVFHLTSNYLMDPLFLGKKHRLIVSIHDLLAFPKAITSFCRKDSSVKKFYGQYCIFLAKFARTIIVPFEVTKIDLVKTIGFSPENIKVVNFGVDHSRFRPLPEIRKNVSKNSIFFLGEADWREGFDVLLQAFSILSKEMPVDLYVGGKTNSLRLRKLIKLFGVDEDIVKPLGFVPESELPKVYNKATVYVFPSRGGFGLSIFEAMACGTPVIASNTKDVKEVVGEGALLVTPGNVWELEEALRKVLTDSKLQRELSNKGRLQSLKFSWQRMAKETLSIYQEVLETPMK